MATFRRLLSATLPVAIILGLACWVYAQEADADQAKALLTRGVAQFKAKDFKAAKATLLKVDASYLSGAEKKTLDKHLSEADTGIRKHAAAMEAYNSAAEALKKNDLLKAKEGFATAAASEFFPEPMRKDARAQLALVKTRMEAAAIAEAVLRPRAKPAVKLAPEPPAAPEPKPAARLVAVPTPEPVLRPPAAPEPKPAVEAVWRPGAKPAVKPALEPPAAPEPKLAPEPVAAPEPKPAPELMAAPEPKLAPEPLAAPEPVAAPRPEPVIRPPAEVEPPQEDQREKMLAAMEARRAKARGMLADGKSALNNNQPEEAVKFFSRALDLEPDLAEARKLLNYARQLTGTVSEAGALSRLERRRRITKQRAELEFYQAMARSNEMLSRAKIAADFDSAADAARLAQNILQTGKSLFPVDEYRARRIKVEDQLKYIHLNRQQWEKSQVAEQLADQARLQAQRETQERQRRADSIRRYTRRTRELMADRNYKLAQKQLEQILKLDPKNSWAIGQKEALDQFILIMAESGAEATQRTEEQKSMVSLRASEVPWYQLLRYPHDWRELTDRRLRRFAVRATGDSEADLRVRQRLAQKIPELDFDEIAFEDVVEFLRDVSGLNIHVNWNALQNATVPIEKDAVVNVHLTEITLKKALRIILDDVGGGAVELSYVIDEGVITISTKEDLESKTYTHVYDIQDLIVRVPNFAGPRLGLQEGGGGDGDGVGGGSDALFGEAEGDEDEEAVLTKAELIERITTLITENIDPDSWRPTGIVGSISELGGQLIVTQTVENHEKLMNLIEQLRETRALQISIEARFISVNSSFLQSIGLDMNFYFNLGSKITGEFVDPATGLPTMLGLIQDSTSFTNMIQATPIETGVTPSIGSTITSHALSIAGTFLDDIQVDFLIRATQAHSDTRLLTAPRITLFNGQRAYISVIQERQYVTDYNIEVVPITIGDETIYTTETEITTEILRTGTLLDVEATVSADRRYVTLTLRPQISSFIRLRPVEGLGFVELPETETKSIETTVTVPDGGTLLFGGQRMAGEVEREMGAPILSKIPIINRAFTNRGKIRDEQTLLILVKPKIIIQAEAEEDERLYEERETFEPGFPR